MTTLTTYRCPSGDYLLSPASTVLSPERLLALEYLGVVSLDAFDDVMARNLLSQIESRGFAVLTQAQFRSGRNSTPRGATTQSQGEGDAID